MGLPTFLGQMLLEHHVLPTNVEIIQDNAKASCDKKCTEQLSLLNPLGSSPRQQEPRCRWRRALVRQASDGKLFAPVRRRESLLQRSGSDSNLFRDVQPETSSIDRRTSPCRKPVRQVSDEKPMKPVRQGSSDFYLPPNWKDLSGRAGDSKLFIPSRRGSMDMDGMQQSLPETRKRTIPAATA